MRKLFKSYSDVFLIFGYVVLLALVNQSWLYNPYGWVDQWGYLGQSLHFPFYRLIFPTHPAGDLYPVIIPVAILFKVFSPVVGNYVKDLSFLFIFLVILYKHCSKVYNKQIAMIMVVIAGSYQYLLSALGSDYTDGYVLFYYAISLFLISKSRTESSKIRNGFLVISGLFFSFMVYSAIMSVTSLPILFLYSVMFFPKSKNYLKQLLWNSFRFLLFFLAGFIIGSVIFSVINCVLIGDPLFFINNLNKLFEFVGGAYSAPPFSLWLGDASWLILPSAISITAVLIVVFGFLNTKSRNLFQYLASESNLVMMLCFFNLAGLIFVNIVIKQWTLQFLYFHQIIPIVFLGLAGILYKRENITLSLKKYIFLVAFSLYTLFLLNKYTVTYKRLRHFVFENTFTHVLYENHHIIIFFLFIIGFVALFLRYRKSKSTYFILGFLLLGFNYFSFSPSFGGFLSWNGFAQKTMPKLINSSKKIFLLTIELSNYVNSIDPTRTHKLWYNENELFGPVIRQVNAVSYLNIEQNRLNKSFPLLEDFSGPLGSAGSKPEDGDKILLITLSGQKPEEIQKLFDPYSLKLENFKFTSLVKEETTFFFYTFSLSKI